MLIAIDPGVQKCGFAFYQNTKLVKAGYEPDSAIWAADVLIIEMPRIYPGSGQQKGDLNDLLDLAAVVGRLESTYSVNSRLRVFPAQWKGQVPKKIMNARVLSKLSIEERLVIPEIGVKVHNVIDAVGIGLWYLGRL